MPLCILCGASVGSQKNLCTVGPLWGLCGVHCGATVVPDEVETPTGVRYKCPECEKFMRPSTKKEDEAKGPLPLQGAPEDMPDNPR